MGGCLTVCKCIHESAVKTTKVVYSFVFDAVMEFPQFSGTRHEEMHLNIGFTLTRVSLRDKLRAAGKMMWPLADVPDLTGLLSPGEFFLLSDCCCPCKWSFIPSFPALLPSVGTLDRSLAFASHPPPDISGHAVIDANVGFGLAFNTDVYPKMCSTGSENAFAAQSAFWPTFDGVTPQDPILFSHGLTLPVASYSGDSILDPGALVDLGWVTNPPYVGYFMWYNPDGTLPPAVITGVSGSGHNFREPCSPTNGWTQSVTWGRTVRDGGQDVSGSGSAAFNIAFGI